MKKTISGLADLATVHGGAVARRFDQLFRDALADLMDRPGVGKVWEVNVALKITPVTGQEGALQGTKHDIVVSAKGPKYAVQAVMGRPTEKGLVYDDLSPKDHDQMTLDLQEGESQQTEE